MTRAVIRWVPQEVAASRRSRRTGPMLGVGCRNPMSAALAVVGAFDRSAPVDASVVDPAGAAVEAETSVQPVVAQSTARKSFPLRPNTSLGAASTGISPRN